MAKVVNPYRTGFWHQEPKLLKETIFFTAPNADRIRFSKPLFEFIIFVASVIFIGSLGWWVTHLISKHF
jgi:hypothetical protein